MHDLSLGPPVCEGRNPEAKHSGDCYDGVYGCHLCWDAANDGRGEVDNCEICNRVTFTQIVRAPDEPVMRAICAACTLVQTLASWADDAEDDDDPQEAKRADERWRKYCLERDRLAKLPDEEALALKRA